MMMLFWILLVTFAISACTEAGGGNAEMVVDGFQPREMSFVSCFVDTVALGTNDTAASLQVRPELRSYFAYEFYMGNHEVTRREYGELMDVEFPEDELDLPVTQVSYYDAILYANALSKADSLDTVYTYVGATFNKSGNCVALDGLSTHYEVAGYRLPTEAEWIYVAKKNWNPRGAWFSERSEYHLQNVCTSKPAKGVKADVFCDFAGNAKEWVGDWLGNFRDTLLENYVGALKGNLQGERVLKGGSVRDDSASVHWYDRGDVYTVTGDMVSDYVGFRLAYGRMTHFSKLNEDGRVVDYDVEVPVDVNMLREKLGTLHSKLVFRDAVAGHLGFVDFITGRPVARLIGDTLDIYHPVISPDGRMIAFCTKEEGVSGESELNIQMLEGTLHNRRKLEVKSAALPRWRILPNGDTVIVYATSAGVNTEKSTWRSYETWQVKVSNFRFGKPEKLMEGSFSGGISADGRLAISGARKLRARLAKDGETVENASRDTVWFNDEQACNASIASDGSRRTLFLDFGSKTGRKFVGEKYSTHQRILVVDSLGNLVQTVAAPEGFTFDHTEWVPGRNLAVATLEAPNGMHPKIVLVDFADSTVSVVAEGLDLGFPDLWVYDQLPSEKSKLDPDSAGVYMPPGSGVELAIYRYKLELLWRYRDTADIVILGSSRSMAGVDPTYVKAGFAVNLAQTPNSIYTTRDFFKRYVLGNFKRLKTIVLSLDLDFWSKRDNSEDNFFHKRYKEIPGFLYDKNHGYWKGAGDDILRFTENAYGTENPELFLYRRGLYLTQAEGWGKKPSILGDSTWSRRHPEYIDDSFEALESILEEAQKKGIAVIGVIFPQNPGYRKTGAFGRYGLRRSDSKDLIRRIKDLRKTYSNFYFMDENRMGSHDYGETLFRDDDHLVLLGSHHLGLRLDSLLRSIDSP